LGELLGATPAGVEAQFTGEVEAEMETEAENVRIGEEIARLAEDGLGGHEDLTRAILRMSPSTLGREMGVDDDGAHLDEAVRRLAEAEAEDDGKEHESWLGEGGIDQ
jgi:hypothetical protein